MNATYDPSVFDAANRSEAQAIILTNEGRVSTDVRWRSETPYLLDTFGRWFSVAPEARLLDFGCGVGRLSKAVADRYGVEVTGVDLSTSMRQFAIDYVQNPLFTAISPDLLDRWTIRGAAQFDAALAVWVLQHCPNLRLEVDRLYRALKPKGSLFVVDMFHRAVPTADSGWIDDAQSVHMALSERFTCVQRLPFDAPDTPENLRESAWIGIYARQ